MILGVAAAGECALGMVIALDLIEQRSWNDLVTAVSGWLITLASIALVVGSLYGFWITLRLAAEVGP